MTQKLRVAIIGAGPAGLTAALAAHRQGFSVSLFEQTEEPHQVEGGVLLHSNGLRVLAALDLLDSFLTSIRSFQRLVIENAEGRPLAGLDYSRLPIPHNYAALAMRQQLLGHLRAALRESDIPILHGYKLTGLVRASGRAHLRFESGNTDSFDVVIAADGLHSRTRKFTGLNARYQPSRESLLRGICSIDLRDGEMREIWGSDGRRFGICPMKTEHAYFYCSVPREEWEIIQSSIAERERWIQTWDGFSELASSVLRATDDWSTVSYSETAEIHLDRWYRPPVFVIGDAAHAMTPHLGQGVNSAMVDALLLMRILGQTLQSGGSMESAGQTYESIRRPYIRRIQTASRRTALLSGCAAPVRSMLLSLHGATPQMGRRTALLAAGYNPAEEPYLARMAEDAKL